MSTLTIYRKTGAVRFTADPLRNVVFVSFAKPLERKGGEEIRGRRRYRWEEKVTIALDPQEASIIGAYARLMLSGNQPKKTPIIRHTPERFGRRGPEKILRFEKKDDGGIFIEIEVRNEKISVGPIGFSDFYLIDSFLTRYIPEILPRPRVPVPPAEEEIRKEEEMEEVPPTAAEEEIF